MAVAQRLRGRSASVLLAFAVSCGAGLLGSVVTRHAAPVLLAAPVSVANAASAAGSPGSHVTVAGFVEALHGALITVFTTSSQLLDVTVTPQTQYLVHPSPSPASSSAVAPGVFVVVSARVDTLRRMTAWAITVIPHFRGARPGFEGHRDGLMP